MCENRVIGLCIVMLRPDCATGVMPFDDKQFNSLQLNSRSPKARVTSSNLVGRAIFALSIHYLQIAFPYRIR